jgi:hypothetical protein
MVHRLDAKLAGMMSNLMLHRTIVTIIACTIEPASQIGWYTLAFNNRLADGSSPSANQGDRIVDTRLQSDQCSKRRSMPSVCNRFARICKSRIVCHRVPRLVTTPILITIISVTNF